MTGMTLYLLIILPPLIASIITGFFGFAIGKKISHSVAILGVFIATIASYVLFYQVQWQGVYFNGPLYTWLTVGSQVFSVGLLIDHLTSVMLVVVTSVSLMVHIYTIGYMAHEEGYQRFFTYTALFTFMMIMLVTSNNFIQLFFGWEGVGLVSYLLIGFYFKRESAIFANLKAFLVNRVGDFGFLLGIGLVLAYCGSLNYNDVFNMLPALTNINLAGTNWNIITVICILLFVGAMGKSAQFPLHVWLPDSMEGPTPISALIHAATMVTAGIFMVARLSPMYNLSSVALSLMIIVGGINCLFLGILGIIQTDIKKVIAYSTLSQLGYMVVALGCGAYSVAIFHLMTHAFFKGLLFLAAGSVIIAMHHEQDMRKMGGLAKYMPITYITMLIGSLALAGIPPFAGFFSKDMILESARVAYSNNLFGSGFAVFTVYTSVFVTALYSFRLIFLTFHGKERFHEELHYDPIASVAIHSLDRQALETHSVETRNHNDEQKDEHDQDGHQDEHHHVTTPHESPWVVTIPLILLAIPSLIIGYLGLGVFTNDTILFGAVYNISWYVIKLQNEMVTPIQMIWAGFKEPPVYIALLGIIVAWIFHIVPNLSAGFVKKIKPVYHILDKKYYMDDLYIKVFAPIGRATGKILWVIGDMILIDGLVVNGVARLIEWFSQVFRKLQSGYVNTYATFMILGVIILLTFCTKLIFS